MTKNIQIKVEENMPLAPLTTIKFGGKAKYFIRCRSVEDIKSALSYAKEHYLRVYVLGGGSNTIFAGESFNGLVIKIDLQGLFFEEQGDYVTAVVQAGENWDDFVSQCVEQGLAGVECLSGIPGSVGATPMQNVGAYGQSVADTIVTVKALKKDDFSLVKFNNKECKFAYRSSRFKYEDDGKYIITEVVFQLKKNGPPALKYPELLKAVQTETGSTDIGQGPKSLKTVRDTVIRLRKKKSMVLDPADPNSQSCGSFFMNPIISPMEFSELSRKWQAGHDSDIPHFTDGENIKVPAGWLIEKAGFNKGYRHGRVGISYNHTLALVNYGGTIDELLSLAEEIKDKVKEAFDIELKMEPVLVE